MRIVMFFMVLLPLLPTAIANDKPSQAKRKAPADPQFQPQRNERTTNEVDIAREQQKLRMKQRYQDLRQDSDKLLKLANELKAEVEKTDENVLSIEVINKAQQIEKLAKSVRNKMKQTEAPI